MNTSADALGHQSVFSYLGADTMHAGAYHFVEYMARCLPPRAAVIELGGRDVNGSVRSLFGRCEYVGVDAEPGPGVDFVGNAATWKPDPLRTFDTVICTEVLEHTSVADRICANAFELLEPGGVFIVTAASIGRVPHSAIDGGTLRHGEFYRNVSPFLLRKWLESFHCVLVDTGNVTDVYALAIK
jgi:SAM-dependent methyltransferase